MAISRTKTADTHFKYGPGRPLLASDMRTAVEHLNYVLGEHSDMLFSMAPHHVAEFSSSDTNVLRFRCYIPSDKLNVRIAIRGQAGYWDGGSDSARLIVTVGGATAQNFTINNGNHLTTQTATVTVAATGTGVQLVTVTSDTHVGSGARALGLLAILTEAENTLAGVTDE